MNAFLLRLEKKARMSNLSNTIQYDTGGNSNRQAIRQKKKGGGGGRKTKRMDIQIKKIKIKLSY